MESFSDSSLRVDNSIVYLSIFLHLLSSSVYASLLWTIKYANYYYRIPAVEFSILALSVSCFIMFMVTLITIAMFGNIDIGFRKILKISSGSTAIPYLSPKSIICDNYLVVLISLFEYSVMLFTGLAISSGKLQILVSSFTFVQVIWEVVFLSYIPSYLQLILMLVAFLGIWLVILNESIELPNKRTDE